MVTQANGVGTPQNPAAADLTKVSREYGISIYFTPIQSIPLQPGETNKLSLKENCFLLAK